ncbi:MAG: hypothetical protein R3C39_04560 [Dehalococcoidia bacterium]
MARWIRLVGSILVPLVLVAITFVLGPRPAVAQEPPIPEVDVVFNMEPGVPRLGERVRLTVTVTHPSDLLIVATRPLQSSEAIDVIEVVPAQSVPLDDRTVTEFAYVFAPYDLGPIDLGSLVLSALDDSGARSVIEVPLPPLGIQATVTQADLELRPLPPQLDTVGAPPPWRQPAALAGAFGLLAVIALIVLWRTWRWGGADEVLTPLRPATAEDRARRRLDAIGRAGLVQQGEFEAYYGELSIAVRDYLEERFDFRATALTTRELERRARNTSIDRWQARLVGGLLQRCDAAIYAGVWPDPASADHDLTLAYEIVELSRPRREEDEPEAVPA